MSSPAGAHAPVDYREVQSRAEFQELKRTHRSFVFPMTVVFIVWYLVYVLMAAFLPQVMAIQVFGNINVGIIMGLLQFLTTFVITGLYVAFSNSKLDPKASKIRHELEAAGIGLPDETPDDAVVTAPDAGDEASEASATQGATATQKGAERP